MDPRPGEQPLTTKVEAAAETAEETSTKRPLDDEATERSILAPAEETKPKRKKKKVKKSEAQKAFDEQWNADQLKYRWLRTDCDPDQFNGRTEYFYNQGTGEQRWDEPDEPYWIWNSNTQSVDAAGLQHPSEEEAALHVQPSTAEEHSDTTNAVTSSTPAAAIPIDARSDLTHAYTTLGLYQTLKTIPYYDRAIHGGYDTSQPYHERYRILKSIEDAAKLRGIELFREGITRREQDDAVAQFELSGAAAACDPRVNTPQQQDAVIAHFNKATGLFQTADQGPSRHSDDAKSYRQMNAFFDVEAAANANNGQSWKEERRNIKYTKKEIAQFKAKKEEKKRKKLLDWART